MVENYIVFPYAVLHCNKEPSIVFEFLGSVCLLLVVLFSLIWLLFCNVEISSMGAMAQRLQRMRLICGSNQKSWLITVAMQKNGSTESIEIFEAPLIRSWGSN